MAWMFVRSITCAVHWNLLKSKKSSWRLSNHCTIGMFVTCNRCVGHAEEVAALVAAMVRKGPGHGPDFFTVDVRMLWGFPNKGIWGLGGGDEGEGRGRGLSPAWGAERRSAISCRGRPRIWLVYPPRTYQLGRALNVQAAAGCSDRGESIAWHDINNWS